MLRQFFVGLIAMSTIAVAPATAEVMRSEELNAPLTRVSEVVQPISKSQPKETEEQFPKVSELQEQEIEATVIQPAQLEVANTGTSKERSQTESLEYKFDSSVKLEPFQVEPSQPQLKPSRAPTPIVTKVVPFNAKGRLVEEKSNVVNEPTLVRQGTSKERSQAIGSNNNAQFSRTNVQILEPSRVVPAQPIQEPSPVVEQKIEQSQPSRGTQKTGKSVANNIIPFRLVNQAPVQFTPEVTHDFSLEFGKSSTPNLEPKTAFSLDRATKTKVNWVKPSRVPVSTMLEAPQPRLEPSRVVKSEATANPFIEDITKTEDVKKPITPKVNNKVNNIVGFKRKQPPIAKTVPPSKVALQTAVSPRTIPTKSVTKDSQAMLGTAYSSRREITAFAPETAFSLGHQQRYLGTESFLIAPETAYSFSHDINISGTADVVPKTVYRPNRDINMTNVPTEQTQRHSTPISTNAADLGVLESTKKVQEQAAKVETQPKLKPKPAPKVSVSAGLSDLGKSAKIETAVGLEYEGLSATLNHSRPLDGQGPNDLGLDVTLPISEKAKLTISTAQINTAPTISATVESKISEQLTASASFNNVNKPDFNLELAANYQIDKHWSVAASGNVMTRQINVGTTYTTGRGIEANVKVDNIANLPQVGVGLGIELSPSTKLELSANSLNSNPTLGVKVTQSFSF